MKPSRESLTAILVDDDSAQAYLLARLLNEIEWLDVELLHFSQPKKAMANLLTEEADLILLDHHLGEGKTGLEILRALRDMGFDGPIVMLTGSTEADLVDDFLRFGADVYIDKADLTPDRISEAIQVALRVPHKLTPRIING